MGGEDVLAHRLALAWGPIDQQSEEQGALHNRAPWEASASVFMPEIERAARDPIYNGAQKVPASLQQFRDATGRLPASIVLQEQHGIRLPRPKATRPSSENPL